MTDDFAAARLQAVRQIAYWRVAAVGLSDLDNFASPDAWGSLERYLDVPLRRHLVEAAEGVGRAADALAAELRAASTHAQLEQLRRRILAFRRRYLQVERALEFFGDAVSSRTTPRLAGMLRACDNLALASLEPVLVPLRHDVPPVLTYVTSGLGASILRRGARLVDGGSLTPVAAVKITRQNLYRTTALIHETGHQAAAILGWNEELGAAFQRTLEHTSPALGVYWRSVASEVAADAYAFAHTGYGSVAGLHDVVSGGPAVFRTVPGDPHPVAFCRVLLAVKMCIRFFGAGPWDDLARAWTTSYPLSAAPPEARELIERSLPHLGRLAEVCLLEPMRAFGGRPLAALVDPLRVRPDALARLAREAGGALATSPHWLRTEGLRLLALTSYRAATEPERAGEIGATYEDWMLRMGRRLEVAA